MTTFVYCMITPDPKTHQHATLVNHEKTHAQLKVNKRS